LPPKQILSKLIAIIQEIFERDLLVSISVCQQDSILLELLDSRHVYISLLFEHPYVPRVPEQF